MSIIDYILWPFGFLIRMFYGWTGNYALALFFFAIVIKLVLFPFGIRQQKNTVKQASLRPKEMAIRKKYAGRDDKVTQQKMNEEIMQLYQREGYSPMGGCLPMLLQFPVIIILYKIVYMPLTYISQLSADALTKLKDAVAVLNPEIVWSAQPEIQLITQMKTLGLEKFNNVVEGFHTDQLPSFDLFGLDLSATPSIQNLSWLVIIPILVFVTTFLSMKLTRRFTYQPPEQQQQAGLSMKIMDFAMPAFSLFISFSLSAAIGVYWIYQSILGFGQQLIMAKLFPVPRFTEEDYRNAEKELGVKNKQEKKKTSAGAVRSLHHIDDEDYLPPAEKGPRGDYVEDDEAPAEKKAVTRIDGEIVDDVSPIAKAPMKKDDKKKR